MSIRKGVSADILPLFFLTLTAPFLLWSSVEMVNTMSIQSGYVVDDLRMATRADSVKGSYLYDYSTLGASYSVNQKSRDLASKGGGFEWNAENLANGEINREKALLKLIENSELYFEENYAKDLNPAGCEVDKPEFEMALKQEETYIKGNISPEKSLQLTCQFEKGNATVEIPEKSNISFISENNRYMTMFKNTTSILSSVRESWSGLENSYTASASKCGGTDGLSSRAESKAVSKAKRSLKSSARDSHSSSDIAEDLSLSESYSLEEYTEASSSGPSEAGSCNCNCKEEDICESDAPPESCGEGSCSSDEIESCDTKYEATSTVEADEAKASLTIKEEIMKILTEKGYRVMKFKVSDYTQKFE